jgi:hypothetical protein
MPLRINSTTELILKMNRFRGIDAYKKFGLSCQKGSTTTTRPLPLIESLLLGFSRARICKRLRSPRIDSEESILRGWESISGNLKRFTNTGLRFLKNKQCLTQQWTYILYKPRSNVSLPEIYNSVHKL